MQWSNETHAGFSSAPTTWLPVAANFTECNVELQEMVESSHLKNFHELIKLREQNPTMKYGALHLAAVDDDVLAYKRYIDGDDNADMIVVVLNLGNYGKVIDLHRHLGKLPDKMRVAVASIHSTSFKPG